MLNCNQGADQFFTQFQALDEVERLGDDYLRSVPHAKMDLRTYGIGAQILKLLGVGQMRLLASPRKMPSMAGFELQVSGYVNKEKQ